MICYDNYHQDQLIMLGATRRPTTATSGQQQALIHIFCIVTPRKVPLDIYLFIGLPTLIHKTNKHKNQINNL
jgi:hypothetical protein